MPYYKRRRRITKAAARRGRRRYNAVNTAALPPERKYMDFYRTGVTVPAPTTMIGCEINPDSPASIGCLTAPPVGDSATSRDGKHCIIQSLEFKGKLVQDGTTTTGKVGTFVHVCLVLDKQTNGTTLSSEDVYINPSGSAVLNPLALRNPLFGKRFKVLKVWKFLIHGDISYNGTNLTNRGVTRTFECFLKMHMPVNFNAGTTASVANVIDNSIHCIAWADRDATPNDIQLSYQGRIRFIG
jgi:hypothetical protein